MLDSIEKMAERGGSTHHLPNAALIFPELLEPPEAEETPLERSCADLIETGVQHILINDAIATTAAGYVFRLLYRKPLTSFVCYVSLDAVRPVKVSLKELNNYLD